MNISRLITVLTLIAVIPALMGQIGSPVPSSPEAVAVGLPELRQVNFRLMRVASEVEFNSDPAAYERIDTPSVDDEIISMPVDPTPLMTVTELDRAVIRRSGVGLHYLDLHLTEEDAAAYADVTADNAGERVLWVSRDNILLDLLLVGRDTTGRLSLFYGDTPFERIERVLQVLQVPFTVEMAEPPFEPESEADELLIEAMRAFDMDRTDEAILALQQVLMVGGGDYPRRARVLMVLGTVSMERGDATSARQCFEAIRNGHPDFPERVGALRGLVDLALMREDADEAMRLCREIVAEAPAGGAEALGAQSILVDLLWREEEREDEARRETRRLLNHLQSHVAGLPASERFRIEHEVLRLQLRLDQVDEAMLTVRSLLDGVSDSPQVATLQVLLICDVLGRSGHGDRQQEIIDEYAEQFAGEHDTESEDIGPIWEQITLFQEQVRQSLASPEA